MAMSEEKITALFHGKESPYKGQWVIKRDDSYGAFMDAIQSSEDFFPEDVLIFPPEPTHLEGQYSPVGYGEVLKTALLPLEHAFASHVMQEVSELKMLVEKIRDEVNDRPLVKTIQIYGLSDQYELVSPISILIEVYKDETIARQPELEAIGSGNTEAEAIQAMKDDLINLYLDLKETAEEELGKIPAGWKKILERLIAGPS